MTIMNTALGVYTCRSDLYTESAKLESAIIRGEKPRIRIMSVSELQCSGFDVRVN